MESQGSQHDARVERASSENIGPEDPRYADLNRRGFNKRFEGKPDYIRLVGSTEDIIDALQHAFRSRLRLAVRSAGIASRASSQIRRCARSSTCRR